MKDLIGFVCFKIADAFQKWIYIPYTSYGTRITSGFIYKKKMISRKCYYIFGHEFICPEAYRFYILYFDKKVSFDVSEGTYCMYSIGDWFDSQNPQKSENVKDDVLIIGNCGGRDNFVTFYYDINQEISVSCGCFSGKIDEFEKRVNETYGDSKYGREYKAAIELAKIHIMEE